MKTAVVSKQEIKELFSSLITESGGETRIYVPAVSDDRAVLAQFSPESGIIYNYRNFLKSPKGIFFPQREILCSFNEDGLAGVPKDNGRIILFGIRPCDAKALLHLDKVFSAGSAGFADPYYLERRENSLVISLACIEPDEGCFCTSLGGGPDDPGGSDIVAYDFGDRLLFETHTVKGEGFLEEYPAMFNQPESGDIEAREELRKAAFSAVDLIDVEDVIEKLDVGFDDDFWEEVTATCLGCGVCTYLCPTCHCFNIIDEKGKAENGIRARTWDSCQYPLFTKHASGHNPRVDKKQRLRQRIMHKFSYAPQTTGDIFCVGCGRCVRKCPVNLDIREVLRRINGDD